ncbi:MULTISPECIES: ABC transporter permease [unclassified Bradyrhizobium]|uniref:ABC transporter permease n=1 Tax=unclassified Bradyrhizobium TaxID=2631580 RepID=UPI002FE195F8
MVIALVGAVGDGSLLRASIDTLAAAFGGLGAGGAAGLLAGVVLGMARPIDRLLEVTLESLRPIPPIALLPIALIVLGFGYRMEICVVAFACFWPVMILSRTAVRSIEPRLVEVARVLELSYLAKIIKIVLPASLSTIFLAFRLAAGVALIVSVTVEITINPIGLGAGIMTAQQALRPDLMLAYLVWIGLIGYVLNDGLFAAQRLLFGPLTTEGRHR